MSVICMENPFVGILGGIGLIPVSLALGVKSNTLYAICDWQVSIQSFWNVDRSTVIDQRCICSPPASTLHGNGEATKRRSLLGELWAMERKLLPWKLGDECK